MREEMEAQPGFRWLSWILRILLIVIALYLEIFSLDVFKSGFPFWKTVLAFVLHSVPSIALLFVLYISFKWEHIAGFTIIFFALMGTLPFGPPNDKNLFVYIILGSMTLIGILFVLNYFIFGSRRMGENL
jgi:hypothetical protein